ncbi:MAG: membrane protein insertion efficiency factor YidD [Planctomycetota bacterium]
MRAGSTEIATEITRTDATTNSVHPARRSIAVRAALLSIRGYQRFLRPLLPPLCRFQPTCSCYAAEAVEAHGLLRGGFIAARRLVRCQPFSRGGYDPIPQREEAVRSDDNRSAP